MPLFHVKKLELAEEGMNVLAQRAIVSLSPYLGTVLPGRGSQPSAPQLSAEL